jgi:hypothetical protein
MTSDFLLQSEQVVSSNCSLVFDRGLIQASETIIGSRCFPLSLLEDIGIVGYISNWATISSFAILYNSSDNDHFRLARYPPAILLHILKCRTEGVVTETINE